jgi:5-methylcytosine-specific restriction endonuclease McrA
MADVQPSKTCTKCGETKPLAEFHRESVRPETGHYQTHRARCRSCDNDRHRVKALLRTKEYRSEERRRKAEREGRVYIGRVERLALSQKKDAERKRLAEERRPERDARDAFRWWWSNCSREWRRLYTNAEFRAHYERNRAKEVARVAGYKRRNADRNREWSRRRAARMAIAGGLTAKDLNQIKAQARECFYCAKPLTASNRTVDHREPICLGGSNDRENVVAACKGCNQAKGYRSWVAWFAQLPAHHQKLIRSALAA